MLFSVPSFNLFFWFCLLFFLHSYSPSFATPPCFFPQLFSIFIFINSCMVLLFYFICSPHSSSLNLLLLLTSLSSHSLLISRLSSSCHARPSLFPFLLLSFMICSPLKKLILSLFSTIILSCPLLSSPLLSLAT